MRIARITGFALAILAAGCGGGGGGNGGIASGPLAWGIPFVPTDLNDTMVVGLRNNDTDGTTVTLQGYMPDGTPYSAPVAVTLSGLDEHRFGVVTALGGNLPAGGWISATTPTGKVEVYASVIMPGKAAEEAMRAFPAPNPIPSPFLVGVSVTPQTDTIQITNATGIAIVVAVTAYQEPGGDPFDPPIAFPALPVALGPFETKLYTPDGLSGISSFEGSFQLSSPSGFLAAAREDLGFDVSRAQVDIETRLVEVNENFGREAGFGIGFDNFWDFALVARNNKDTSQTITLTQVGDQSGSLLPFPVTVLLEPFESRIMTSGDFPFADILQISALESTFLQNLWIEASVPEGVDLTARQFDPVVLSFNMVQRPVRQGHLFSATDVLPQPTINTSIRTILSVTNPGALEMEVTIEALIPEPDDFDGTPVTLTTLLVPGHTRVDLSPDGAVFLDRDLDPATFIGLKFFSVAPFYVTGRRERRVAPDSLILSLSPIIIRNLDEKTD